MLAESLRYFCLIFTAQCGFHHLHFTILKMTQMKPSTHAAVHGRLDAFCSCFCPKDWNHNVESGLNQPCYEEPSKKQSLDTRYKYSVHTGPLCETPNPSLQEGQKYCERAFLTFIKPRTPLQKCCKSSGDNQKTFACFLPRSVQKHQIICNEKPSQAVQILF